MDLHIAAAEDPLDEAAEHGEVHAEVPNVEEGVAHHDRPSTDGIRPSAGPLPPTEFRGRRSRRRPFASRTSGRKDSRSIFQEDWAELPGRSTVSSYPNRLPIGGALGYRGGTALGTTE